MGSGAQNTSYEKGTPEDNNLGDSTHKVPLHDASNNLPAVHSSVKEAGKTALQGEKVGRTNVRTSQRRDRTKEGSKEKLGVQLGAKRDPEPMEVDSISEVTLKRGKMGEHDNFVNEAGLSEQLRRNQ
jgi:hypothetical protein